MTAELHLAEIPDAEGRIHIRYSRYLSADGARWIRHGLFEMYHPGGVLASTGVYEHGTEEGLWRDFHSDGSVAAEGFYRAGQKTGAWRYRDLDGTLSDETY